MIEVVQMAGSLAIGRAATAFSMSGWMVSVTSTVLQRMERCVSELCGRMLLAPTATAMSVSGGLASPSASGSAD